MCRPIPWPSRLLSLVVGAQLWSARSSQALDRLRSRYPIPPGLTGTTVKLLLNVALPWLGR